MSAAMLQIDDIHAGYGPIEVLKGVSMRVDRGEIVTLIGCNGAGKTSTLHCVSGLNRVRSGRIVFDGQEIQDVPADQLVRRGLAQVPEGRKIFPRLTVLENLVMGAVARNDPAGVMQDLDKVYHLFPVLKERQSQMGGTLSGGEQQMLAIARALMSRPKMLLMDEPSMGIAPLLVLKIFQAVRELNQAGMTILLVEQNARLALKLANRGYVLENGHIVMHDDANKLAESDEVRKAYLGVA
jgi:branched-chain amino acid transport system ATP-binding protein